jgi:hypothetical protein
MNLDLYTEEFRNFKYLKCPSAYINYYKKVSHQINSVQSGTEANDPNFVWPCRLEFIEQLLDLQDSIVYLVEAGMLYNQKDRQIYDYEAARLCEIINPIIYQGSMLSPETGRIATLEDIPIIEDKNRNKEYILCPGKYYTDMKDFQAFSLDQNPLIPTNLITYNAMFYDKEVAEKYQLAVTIFLRKNIGALSAITTLF